MKVQKIITPQGYRYIVLNENYEVIEPLKDYLKYLDRINKSPNTLKNYAHHLCTYCKYLSLIDLDILDINKTQETNAIKILSGYIYWLQYDCLETDNIVPISIKRTNNTINIMVGTVLDMYEYLYSIGLLNELDIYKEQRKSSQFKGLLYQFGYKYNSTRTNLLKLKSDNKELEAINREQYNQLIENCNLLRDKIIIALMFEGGLRIGETLGIQISDISFRENMIYITPREDNPNEVYVKNHKGGYIVLPNYVFKWIRDYILEDLDNFDSNYLFLNLKRGKVGEPIKEVTIEKLFERLSEKVGYKVTPHMCRHGFATERSIAGWDVKQIQQCLRHKNISTTSLYINLNQEIELKRLKDFYKSKGIELGGMFNE